MVISRLLGGLGNQMFQYAAARALSLRKGTKLALDVSAFDQYELHQGFELKKVFNCTFEVASKADINSVLGWQSAVTIQRIVSRKPFSLFIRKHFIAEPHFKYWSGLNNLKNDCYLSGYWQSEKYFVDFIDQIREDFQFRHRLEGKNVELSDKIMAVNAVSLHVRRGDYINNPKTMATHGLCTLEYYRDAIQYVANRVEQPQFFIFSDDIEWAKSNLKIDFPHAYVQHNRDKESYNDMHLMSLCQHHIIANSSFSWWGAWLNPGIDKIVVVPKKWFVTQTDVRDLLPNGWMTL